MVLNIPNGLIMLDGTLSPHEKNLQLALNHNCPPPPQKEEIQNKVHLVANPCMFLLLPPVCCQWKVQSKDLSDSTQDRGIPGGPRTAPISFFFPLGNNIQKDTEPLFIFF